MIDESCESHDGGCRGHSSKEINKVSKHLTHLTLPQSSVCMPVDMEKCLSFKLISQPVENKECMDHDEDLICDE